MKWFEVLCAFVAGVQFALAYVAHVHDKDWAINVLIGFAAVVLTLASWLRTPQ